MTRCSGCFSGDRAIPVKRTRVGKTDRSAEREMDCCDVFVTLAARPITKPSRSYTGSPIFILTGSHPHEHCKTSTFTGRLRTLPG